MHSKGFQEYPRAYFPIHTYFFDFLVYFLLFLLFFFLWATHDKILGFCGHKKYL